jgi:putative ABC transport system permease protein
MALTDRTIIARSLRSRLFSTSTTVLTVAVAVGLMLVLLTMRQAGRQAFERGSGDMHLLVTAESSPLVSVLNGIFYANPPRRPLDWGKVQLLSRSFPWAYAIPTQQGDSFNGLPIMATTTDFFEKFKPNQDEPWEFAQGKAFDGNFQVVVGSAAAASSGLKLGDKLFITHGINQSRQLGGQNGEQTGESAGEAGHDDHAGHDHDHDHDHGHDHAASEPDPSVKRDTFAGADVHTDFTYTVVGILKPTGGSHDRAIFTSLESTWILHANDRRKREDPHITTTTPEDLIDADRKVTGLYLRVATREGSDASAVLPQIFYRLRADPTIMVAQPGREIEGLFKIIGNIDQLFVAMAAVVMLSSGIAIMLALYNSMDQRRRQIAVLRVLGASRARVFRLVIVESVIIGSLGAIVGIVLAVVGGIAAAGVLRAELGLKIDADLHLIPTLGVAGAAIVLAGVAGLIPALVAYRTAVSKNLRPIG